MAKDDIIFCEIFGKEIPIGLCSEVCAVLGKMLKWESVPELNGMELETIQKRCDECPHSQ